MINMKRITVNNSLWSAGFSHFIKKSLITLRIVLLIAVGAYRCSFLRCPIGIKGVNVSMKEITGEIRNRIFYILVAFGIAVIAWLY